jgi:hypothetical protein
MTNCILKPASRYQKPMAEGRTADLFATFSRICCRKTFPAKSIQTETSPLRFASVEMTKVRWVFPGRVLCQMEAWISIVHFPLNLPQASRVAGMAKRKVRNEPTALLRNSIPSDERRVPHICPFWQMWDTAGLALKLVAADRSTRGSHGSSRVPHVRTSVRGPKTMGEAHDSFSNRDPKCRWWRA